MGNNDLRNKIASELYVKTIMLWKQTGDYNLFGDYEELAKTCISQANQFIETLENQNNINKIKG